ncbi:MAG: hypothetical protein KAY32_09870 [Candidatus Eisenbacteria sp.]|nr:hypothetical protein [Candidatus Eisenbacteria bacterium]
MEDKKLRYLLGLMVLIAILSSGCSRMTVCTFPDPNQMFMTTGDGDIQKPYTPVGQVIYYETGYRIPVPILGLLPIADVDPDLAIRQKLQPQLEALGADAVINLRIDWEAPSSGFLGLFANGGNVLIHGTAIRR